MPLNQLDAQHNAHSNPEHGTPARAPLLELKDLPGPKPFPIIGNLHQIKLPRLHADIEQFAKTYGPVFKMYLGAQLFMIVTDHDVIAKMMRDRPNGFRRPFQLRQVTSEMGIKPGVFSAEGPSWQNQRRMVMASFSPANIRRYFPALLRVTQRLEKRWVESASVDKIIDLQSDLMRYTVDVISGLAFGKDINTLESKEEVIQQHLDKVFPAVYSRMTALVPYWRLIKLPKDKALDKSVEVINANIKDFIAQARERLEKQPALREQPENLLEAMIVAADEEGSGVTDDDVVGNVFTMLLAGEDTTATSISWMIYLLFQNPTALKRAQDEAEQAVRGNLGELTPETVAELNYIEACALEAMRLKPVGPLNSLEPLQETVVANVRVPARTSIIALIRPDVLKEEYFHNAKSFNPDRWLTQEGGHSTSNAKRISIPFGSGPRICPGRYLALMEIKMAMVMLLNRFEIIEVNTPDGGEAQELLSFTMVPVGLKMRIRQRHSKN